MDQEKPCYVRFILKMLKRMIYHWLSLRYVCYICYGEKDGPDFFLVTFVSSGVITLSVFSIRYVCYADFYMDQEKPCYVRFILKMLKRMIYHWLSLRYVCYICYGEKDGPDFFLVTFVSSGVITLSVFSIRYVRYADFYMDQEKPCYVRFILKMLKGWFIIDIPFVTFVTFVTGKKMAQIFFSLPLFLLESSLSVYFPFVTFVMLISTWTRKNPVTFVSYWKCWKGWFIIDFPFVTFVTFVTGKKMAQIFFSLPLFLLESSLSVYFPFVTFVMLISTWTRKTLLRSFHIENVEKDDLSLTFPSLRLLHLLRGKRWPRFFSRYLCFFWSHHSQCIFHSLRSLHWFLHGPGKTLLRSFHIENVEKDDLSLTFPSLRLLYLLRGKRWPRFFSRYLCFFWSHHSQCIFHSLRLLRWFLHGPGKTLLRLFHIENVEKDDLSLTFPSLRLLHLLRGKRWPRFFSRYLCFFWSHHSQCIFHSLHSLRWFLHGPGKTLLRSFHIINVEKDD